MVDEQRKAKNSHMLSVDYYLKDVEGNTEHRIKSDAR
jgi:hypothetical protein